MIYRLMDSVEAIVGLRANRLQALGRIWRGVSPVHCWEGGPDYGTTCMRWSGHRGRHEWTSDDEIGVTFAPEPVAPGEGEA
jgi:hypothetical protein